jgi:alkylated DNA repair protein (DNA oxidative demethylase)
VDWHLYTANRVTTNQHRDASPITAPLTGDLLAALPAGAAEEILEPGACILRGFAHALQAQLLCEIEAVASQAAFRNWLTPGGRRMSVAMTNCGTVGWVSDRSGYRYSEQDPVTRRRWPAMPELFLTLARSAAQRAGYLDFTPDACLVNRYETDTRLSLHVDQDERDATAPIVSVSLGAAATFLWGGLQRQDRTRRQWLASGDVVVWGGAARFVHHGIAPLAAADHPLTSSRRFNLTFRKAL